MKIEIMKTSPAWIIAAAALFTFTLPAGASLISINLTNADGPRQILAGESTGVVDTDGWINLSTTTADVGGTVVDVTLVGTIGVANTLRDKGSGDGTDGFLAMFEAGLRDATPATPGDTSVTVSDMSAWLANNAATSYDLHAYYKSPLNVTPDTVALGLTTASFINVDPDGTNMSVNDSFVEAGNAESNYILFSGLTADTTTIYLNRVSRDGILAGLQIMAIPEPQTTALAVLGGLLLGFLRRRTGSAVRS